MAPGARCLALALAVAATSCEGTEVVLERPTQGRLLTAAEATALQKVAEVAFRDARASLEGLPPRLRIIVTFGKDVIPETGESGSVGHPGNIGLTLDPDRDVLATIRQFVRPSVLHELHHLARASRVPTSTRLIDRVVTEGLATAFERDVTSSTPLWAEQPPEVEVWAREALRERDTTDTARWFGKGSDGRRFAGHRVGTFLVDRATRASGTSAAKLVFTSTAEVLRRASFE